MAKMDPPASLAGGDSTLAHFAEHGQTHHRRRHGWKLLTIGRTILPKVAKGKNRFFDLPEHHHHPPWVEAADNWEEDFIKSCQGQEFINPANFDLPDPPPAPPWVEAADKRTASAVYPTRLRVMLTAFPNSLRVTESDSVTLREFR